MSSEAAFPTNDRLPHGMLCDENGEVYWVPWSSNFTMAGALDAVATWDTGIERDELGAREVWMRLPIVGTDEERYERVETDPVRDALPAQRYWRIEHGI